MGHPQHKPYHHHTTFLKGLLKPTRSLFLVLPLCAPALLYSCHTTVTTVLRSLS
jgi:hypothetical protein